MTNLKLKKYKDVTGVNITTRHNAKMQGLWSISTNKKDNPFCQARSKVQGSICSKCYTERVFKMYVRADACAHHNTQVLTAKVIPYTPEIPKDKIPYFRFESFGDLINKTQVINYFNIAKANPEVHFALWTKNPQIIKEAIDAGEVKPANLNIVLSSKDLNKQDKILYNFIDKVFTVYTIDYIKDHPEVKINCGARSCLKCAQCYSGSVVEINEVLKSDVKKFEKWEVEENAKQKSI